MILKDAINGKTIGTYKMDTEKQTYQKKPFLRVHDMTDAMVAQAEIEHSKQESANEEAVEEIMMDLCKILLEEKILRNTDSAFPVQKTKLKKNNL